MPESLEADLALASRVVDGDEAAFVAMTREYGGAVTRVVRGVIGTLRGASNDVEDVVQEVWIAVLRNLGRFEGRSRLRTWLVGVAINHGRRRFRSAVRRNAHEDPYALPDGLDDADRFDGRGRWKTPVAAVDLVTPADVHDAGHMAGIVDGCLSRLPEKQRLALTLVVVDGMEPSEAASVLGVEDGHLRVLVHRARTAIRSALESWRVGDARHGDGGGGA